MRKHIGITLAALLVVMGVLVFLPSSYVSAGGLVENSGFEQGVESDPGNWTLSRNATRVDIEPIYAGNWSAQVTGRGDVLTQWITNITALRIYEAWGWVYVTGNVTGNVTGVIALDFWMVTEDEVSQLSSTFLLSATDTGGVYVQKAGTMQAPTSTTHVRIRLYGTGWGDEEEVRFDDIGFWCSVESTRWSNYCFIATAAYGTPMAEEIQILREFRDGYLLTNPAGQTLVDLYYNVSPPVAEFITAHPNLKSIVRAGLLPAVAMSTVVVNTTPVEKAAMAGLLMLISVIVVVRVTRRRGGGPEYIRR